MGEKRAKTVLRAIQGTSCRQSGTGDSNPSILSWSPEFLGPHLSEEMTLLKDGKVKKEKKRKNIK